MHVGLPIFIAINSYEQFDDNTQATVALFPTDCSNFYSNKNAIAFPLIYADNHCLHNIFSLGCPKQNYCSDDSNMMAIKGKLVPSNYFLSYTKSA